MKKILTKSIILLTALTGFAILLTSCEYKEVADAEYPGQVLYMPAAINGIFTIDNVPQRVEFLPTPGQAYRFTVDLTNNKLIVPLAVYRAGLDRSGNVEVNISANTDTVTKLKTAAKIPAITGILPSSKFTMPASVQVKNGEELGSFNLEIDLGYLRSFPDTVFAIGAGITSSQATVNPKYNTTIVVLYTKILNPIANFTLTVDATNRLKVTCTNTSKYQMKNLWDFGDGTTDTIKAPVHIYNTAGTYTVTLTAVGVLGPVNQSVKTLPVTVGK